MKTNEALIKSLEMRRAGWLVFFRWRCFKCERMNINQNAFTMTNTVQCGQCNTFNQPEEVFLVKKLQEGVHFAN